MSGINVDRISNKAFGRSPQAKVSPAEEPFEYAINPETRELIAHSTLHGDGSLVILLVSPDESRAKNFLESVSERFVPNLIIDMEVRRVISALLRLPGTTEPFFYGIIEINPSEDPDPTRHLIYTARTLIGNVMYENEPIRQHLSSYHPEFARIDHQYHESVTRLLLKKYQQGMEVA